MQIFTVLYIKFLHYYNVINTIQSLIRCKCKKKYF